MKELPALPRKYTQPGDARWPTSTEIDIFSASINGTDISCLGLEKFVNVNDSKAHKITCLPYNGLEPNNTAGTCKKPALQSTYATPAQICNPSPFITGAYYKDTDNQYACMTPYQFLNNRNHKAAWMAAFIVTPSSPEDIKKSIKFANSHNLGISVMSTGHDMQDRNAGPGPNTLLIRTTCFQEWKVNSEPILAHNGNWSEGYAEVGAGLTFGKNFWWKLSDGGYELAKKAGKEMVGGTCHSVGIVGWTIGGGRGWTSPKYGLGVDQLLHADLVDANGDLVSANYSHNPELFYALRGGGGGFGGVIYRLKIKMHSPSCQTMENCYTVFNNTWTGKYNSTIKQLNYIKKIILTYVKWSSVDEGKTWPAILQLFFLPDGYYKLYIGATSLGRDIESFNNTFGQFKQDIFFNTTIKTSKYWCEVFPDPSNGDNCTTSPWYVARWKQTIRFMAKRDIIQDGSSNGLISTLLKYWQPHCERFNNTVCASAWQLHGDLPAIDETTQEGVYSSGGPVSLGFRQASFNVLNLDVTSLTQNDTFEQDEEWMQYTLGPQMYKFTNSSYFNEAEYTLKPGHWEERFWGKENHCKLVEIKKKNDPNNNFACRHCIGNEVRFNDNKTGILKKYILPYQNKQN